MSPTRRTFLTTAATLLTSSALAPAQSALPNLPEEPEALDQKSISPPDKSLRFAIVGLGKLATEKILPAFAKSQHCRPTALVSGHPDKARTLAQHYNIDPKNIYSYDNYDAIKNNPDIDAVYIVLPNAMHAEYTVRAAQAGKHVLCEKPMATSSADCRRMIDACKSADKKLMVAYRIHFEPANVKARDLLQSNYIGKPKLILSQNTQNQEPNTWRTDKALSGGGSLPDIGLYCLNTTRFLLDEEPVEVQAYTWSTPNDPRFKSVEELCSFTLRFPSGALLSATSTYGAAKNRFYRVNGDQGFLHMEYAFGYGGQHLTAYPKAAEPKEPAELTEFPASAADQFALEMDHFAQSVKENKTPDTPGEEGLKDQLLMEAIYKSADSHQPLQLPT